MGEGEFEMIVVELTETKAAAIILIPLLVGIISGYLARMIDEKRKKVSLK